MSFDAPDLARLDMQYLRALRLHHWQQALRFRKLAQTHKTTGATRQRNWVTTQYDKTANFHLGAVQALNDLFPIGDTAEKDNGDN